MAPFSMKCTSCGEYIYKGRKFNARKETTDESYLKLPIYRFYIRCTRCSSEITFKTDPKNMDYTCERGAKRNFESWRDPESDALKETDEERLARLEMEEAEELENAERDAMEELEGRMKENQREMAIADALDDIRTRNARIERGSGKEEEALVRVRDEAAEQKAKQQHEDEEAVRRAFEKKNVDRVRQEEADAVNGLSGTALLNGKHESPNGDPQETPEPIVTTFERVKKTEKPLLHGLLKKTKPTSTVQEVRPAPKPSGLGLAGYGSDSD